MGEEAKKEEPKTESKAEEKKEDKAEEKKEEKKEESPEEKKEEPKPSSPVVLFVDLHCVGCAKKIERSLMKARGVEEVVIDMAQNHITIKGIVEPQALCTRIQKKTKRKPKILSPLPSAEGEPLPQVVTSQVSGLTTVELNVNMHCEACAEQLKTKILKMRGIQTAETELASGKVKVTGTMDANRLVDYVYRRTKKQARIVPQPDPEPVTTVAEKKEDSNAGEKPTEEEAAKKNDNNDQKQENAAEKKEGEGDKAASSEADTKKEKGGEEGGNEKKEESKDGKEKEEATATTTNLAPGKKEWEVEDEYYHYKINAAAVAAAEEMRRRMYQYYYPPLYVMERVPPPQLFSDENPNACCIS
ncbi:heavy metal-associated isoprenylated plant protein 9 [Macadamia integrifolia]|uniref:heavy metal-associated isoprenylated plant protein 9 n=1 Tax=Macadamia integrifolia TaxID=60698 RepID=UPI001C4EEAD2|nr:heavy metal-associated isoprenylated plant protein 9 [Macadamia integrifolia]